MGNKPNGGGSSGVQDSQKKIISQRYADTDKEAKDRYENNTKDPYPLISTALLNSADIKAYVKKTGMIFPFHEEDLQSASYKVRIGGKVVYYKYPDGPDKVTNEPKREECDLGKPGTEFALLPNSIAFVTLEPYFRIPQYIALRFNLKIKHVYKGLLLGTGPLVDPGFKGKLSIPLHNLTNNTYHFKHGDTLITMEFTKLSNNLEWNDTSNPGHNEMYYKEDIAAGRDVDDYINNALEGDRSLTSVVSSIPSAVNESKNQAVQAKKEAVQAKKEAAKIRNISLGITAATFIAIVGLVITIASFAIGAINKANDRYDDMSRQYYEKLKEYDDKLTQVESEYKAILDELQNNAPTQSSGIAPNP